MPISGPSSYVPTTNLILAHWPDVDAALGAAGPLVLPGGVTLAILTGHRDALLVFASSIQSKANDEEIARGDVNLKRLALLGRLGEFNRKVRGFLAHTPYAKGLPEIPATTAAQGPTLEALDDMQSLWTKINAATIPGFTGPLTLLGGYAVATLITDLAALKTAYITWQNAEQDASLERQKRNDLQDIVYPILLAYRAAVIGLFAEDHALVDNLPRVTPEPGTTPPAVTANIAWDATQLKAKLTWSESTIANLAQYEIRFCAGPNYSQENETVIGNVPPAGPREFLTDSGLAASGDTASFKVYVITADGNERGSNTVTITRP